MSRAVRISGIVVRFLLLGLAGATLLLAAFFLYLQPGLPPVDSLRDVRLQTPLRIYSSDQQLIAEFGEKRRTPVTIDQIPPLQIKAFLAAEDSRFYSHHGVDIRGLTRAALELALTGSIQSGGSTITMQVAKNFFLSRDRTFIRKFNEILLALQIEQELPKDEILELYLNKIYLGSGAYGVEAAAQVYYGRSATDLDLAQMAMIAGLPKAPSANNPLSNPQRALARRDWILGRMQSLGYISDTQAERALSQPVTASYHGPETQLEAPYVAEMARRELVERVGEAAYTEGYRVITTVDSRLQRAATTALRKGLHAYDRRHGYRGPLDRWELPALPDRDRLQQRLDALPRTSTLVPAVILKVKQTHARALTAEGAVVTLPMDTMAWARPYINEDQLGPQPEEPSDVVAPGDVVYVRLLREGSKGKSGEPPVATTAALSQLPRVEGALVALDPANGAIQAVVGGYAFSDSKYNRATQARRQPGSNFKPFLYLAALENGATAATVINDAPIVFDDEQLETSWRPENAGGRFRGPTTLRQALYQSRNLVSIRLLKQVGIVPVIRAIDRMGLDASRLPRDLSLALGTANYTPMEIAKGFALIANGGFPVEPYLIEQIVLDPGEPVHQAPRVVLCEDGCPGREAPPEAAQKPGKTGADTPPGSTPRETRYVERAVDARAVYILRSMLRDVITRGTGRRARALGRNDIAGKTGTTNDQRDAWFSGFNSRLVATAWVGFDTPTPLGRGEYGAVAALPIWLDFMEVALKGMPPATMPQPPGIVTVRIDPETGKRASPGDANAIFEIFREERVPEEGESAATPTDSEQSSDSGVLPQQLF